MITDVKSRENINGTIEYTANVIQSSDSYPFGWDIKERSFSVDQHRFGFNGKENDREWGNQLIQDYGFRLYNPALGKFLSVDPLAPEYPELTTYQFASNTPIQAIDLDGLERLDITLWTNNGQIYKTKMKVKEMGVPLSITYQVYRDEDGGSLYSNTVTQGSFRFNNEQANFQRYTLNADLTFNTPNPNDPNARSKEIEFKESAAITTSTTTSIDNRKLVDKEDIIPLYFEMNSDVLKDGEESKIKRPSKAVGTINATLISATFLKSSNAADPSATIGGKKSYSATLGDVSIARDKVLKPLIIGAGFNLRSSEKKWETSPSVPYSIKYNYQIWKGTKTTKTTSTGPTIVPFRSGMNFGTTTSGNTTTTIAPASSTIAPRSTGTSEGTTLDF